MRRLSHWLCPLLLLGFGGLLIWTPEAGTKFTPFLFLLPCLLMCALPHLFHSDRRHPTHRKPRPPEDDEA